MKKLKNVMAGIVDLLNQMDGKEGYEEIREEFMNKIMVMHAAGLYVGGVGSRGNRANPDLCPFGHPDLDQSGIRKAGETRYVKVVDVDGSLLAVYREAGESELEYAESCPTGIFA